MTGRDPGREAAPAASRLPDPAGDGTVLLAVVAAHRRGQPLHHELLALDAHYECDAATAPVYRMIALAGPGVARGGIVVAAPGASIGVELHRIPVVGLGPLLCALPAPLAIGHVELTGGSALGIVCTTEPCDAVDVSRYGSWPAYLTSRIEWGRNGVAMA